MAQYWPATNRQANFKLKYQWQAQYLPQIERIIRMHARRFIYIRLGTPKEDMEQAADMVLEINGGTIGVRIRKDSYKFRDFTIRSSTPSGYATEIDKLRSGYGDWYVYAWCNDKLITEYMIIDLHKVRLSGLLDMQRSEKRNHDATKFIAITPDELRQAGAMITYSKYTNNF